jgi:16S rRNA (guanine527-N7)-methyltransferase
MSGYDQDDFMRDTGASQAAADRVEIHRTLLADWSTRMNLVGPKELDVYWQRHALDCAQIVRLAPSAKRWVDLGSGAGFPGIIVACLLADVPGAEVHLIESTGKKAAFLQAAIEATGAPARVFHQRIEAFGGGEGRYDVVTARALGPLLRIFEHAKPMLDRGAQGLFHKGADIDAELAAADFARFGGAYQADVLESVSDPRGRILRIRKAAGASVS